MGNCRLIHPCFETGGVPQFSQLLPGQEDDLPVGTLISLSGTLNQLGIARRTHVVGLGCHHKQVSALLIIYLSVPKLSVRFQHRVIQRLYAREGNVALTASVKPKKSWLLVLGGGLGFCVIAPVVMFFSFDIPTQYMQPISALYCVPFLIGMWFLQRPLLGFVALLWPALISIHAIVAGEEYDERFKFVFD